jgi:hypothetical protein
VSRWADPAGVLNDALKVASDYGLSALGWLHVAAALAVGADEIVTTESVSNPIYRAMGIRITAL